jgi:hypothetical protein
MCSLEGYAEATMDILSRAPAGALFLFGRFVVQQHLCPAWPIRIIFNIDGFPSGVNVGITTKSGILSWLTSDVKGYTI